MDQFSFRSHVKLKSFMVCMLMLALVFTPTASPLVLAQDDEPPEPAPAQELPAQETAPAEELPTEITQPTLQPEPQVTPEPDDMLARPPDEPFSTSADDDTFYPASTGRYVDIDDGVDEGNVCTTEDHPCQTITHAVEWAEEGDIINIKPGTYLENITGLEKSLNFQGYGSDTTIIEGTAEDKSVISSAAADVNLRLFGLTIRNGRAAGNGGGIYSAGPLTMRYVHVTRNTAVGGSGGGIYAGGPIFLSNVEVDKNTADMHGGGIYIDLPSTPAMNSEQVTIAENTAPNGSGGGLYLNNPGSDANPTLTLINSTISGNRADDASAVFASRFNLSFIYATIAYNNNSPEAGAALKNVESTMKFHNTIIAHNALENCLLEKGSLISQGYNLESQNSCGFGAGTGDQINMDPKLQPLADNGGDSRTHALTLGSPAIDNGDDIWPYTNDQRDRPRPADGDSNGNAVEDIGAFEFFFPAIVHINAHDPHPSLPGQAVTVQVEVNSDYQPWATGIVDVSSPRESAPCEITLDQGSGSCQLTFSTPGEKTIYAGYRGDANHDRADSSTSHEVLALKSETYKSIGAYDGWVLESARTSSKGGSLNKTGTTIRVGDDKYNRQYRSILHFNTGALPDNAVITSVKLQVRRTSYTGTSPFKTHGALYVDMRKGAFSSSSSLQLSDWQAAASKSAAGKVSSISSNRWHTMNLTSAHFGYINKLGSTQLRLRFAKQDNGDKGADYVSFYSGNASSANQPQLIIEYYVP